MSAFAARAAEDAAPEPILDPYELMPLEIASGLVFGFAPLVSRPMPHGGATAREALERAILPALLRAPCLLSFSGGTASSAVLAVAVQLARREGLEPPVAVTNRIEGLAGAHETARQEEVIIRLGLTEWIRFDFSDELDLVGPVAMRVLRCHGFLWPSHAHVSMPLVEWAAGGSLITGLGQRNALGEPGGLLCRDPGPLPWLRRSAQREVRARWAADVASRPRTARRPPWWAALRQVQIGIELLRRLGAELRVEICHPLIDPVFTSALGELPANQASAGALFGDLLPSKLLVQPPTPIHRNGFWGSHSRELAEGWDGEDVDPALVDPEALRLQWSLPRPDTRTFLLLQAVALARESRSRAALTSAKPVGSEPGQAEPAGHAAEA